MRAGVISHSCCLPDRFSAEEKKMPFVLGERSRLGSWKVLQDRGFSGAVYRQSHEAHGRVTPAAPKHHAMQKVLPKRTFKTGKMPLSSTCHVSESKFKLAHPQCR